MASLEAALARFAATERLDGDNRWAACGHTGAGAEPKPQSCLSVERCKHLQLLAARLPACPSPAFPSSLPLLVSHCRYKCDGCKEYVSADKSTRLEAAPHCLQVRSPVASHVSAACLL